MKKKKNSYPAEFNDYFKKCRCPNKEEIKNVIWNAWRAGYNSEYKSWHGGQKAY